MAAAPGVVRSRRGGALSIMQMYLQYRGQNQANKAKQAEDQWKKTNEVLDYADKFGLDISKFDELNRGLADETNIKLRQGTRNYLQQHPNDFSGAKQYAARTADELKIKVSEYNAWKGTIDDLTKKVNDGYAKGIYNEAAIRRVRGLYLNSDGTLKANRNEDGTLNDWDIRNSMKDAHRTLDDPGIYNLDGIITNIVGSQKDSLKEIRSKLRDYPGGQRTADFLVESLEGGLEYMVDPKTGRYMMDDNHNPVPLINEDWLKIFRNDPQYGRELSLVLDAATGTPITDSRGNPSPQRTKDVQAQIKILQEKVLSKMDQPKYKMDEVKGSPIDQQDKRYWAFGSGFRTPVADLEDRDDRLEKIVTKNRPDLLSGLSDPSSDLGAFYATIDSKGNPVPTPAGQKPDAIVMLHSGRMDGADQNIADQMAATDDVFAKMALMQKAGVGIKPEVYKIDNDENRRKTKIALSLRQDKIDTKRSIGEEYSNYVEAKRKSQAGSIAEKMKAATKKK